MKPEHLQRSRRLKGYAAIVASAICSGAMWPVQKDLMTQVSPLQANWLMIVPALIAILIIYPSRRRGRQLIPKHAPIGWLALFALFAAVIFYTRNVGTHLTSATTAALVVRFEHKLGGQFVTRQEFPVLTVPSNPGQLLAIMPPDARAGSLLTKQHTQHGAHATIADNGDIVEHSCRLEQSAPGMSILQSPLMCSRPLQPAPGAIRLDFA